VSAPTLRGQFIALQNVLYALMLRDIQTRFGSAPGFVIAIAWPLSHILILVLIYVLTGRVVPYGDSAVLWFSIGLTPFMIISYTSRFMMFGLVVNRPLLQFPVISILDVLFSRVLIELFVHPAYASPSS
jgi:capsular polysaccharide transport system permease protein